MNARSQPPVPAELSRRELLSGGFLRSLLRPLSRRLTAPLAPLVTLTAPQKTSPASSSTRTPPLLRPPGAIAEVDFLAGCTRCGDCITACPHQAIRLAPARFRQAAGTPMINPAQQACLACVDTPCISACTPAVLRRPTEAFPVMGSARVSTFDCLAHQGTSCSSCRERCPIPGAITIDRGRPTIANDHCVGCGVCQSVCPAPRNAIMILPRQDRPKVPHG